MSLIINNDVDSILNKEPFLLPLYERYGNRFLQYRINWQNASEYKLETKFPLFLIFELMSSCNYECIMCFRRDKKLYKKYVYKEKLSFETYKRLVDEAVEFGCPSISLNNNNEPLLQNDLERYIEYAAKKGIMDIIINTNASLLNKRRAKSILSSGLTRIMFSLDAITSDTYRKIRGKDNFKEVESNILNFINLRDQLNQKFPITRITFVRLSLNYKEEKKFLEFWKDKCDYISFQEFLAPSYEVNYQHLKPEEYYIKSTFGCVNPWQRLIILGNGKALPCCQHYAQDLTVGSIYQQSMYAIWNSEKMKALRKMTKENIFPSGSICQKCKDSFIYGDIK